VLPVVLASASPRRKELLERAGVAVTVLSADIDESPLPGEAAVAMARRLARSKADRVQRGLVDAAVVVAADTIVVRDGAILSKPTDDADARRMIASLSGREHDVITGYAVVSPTGEIVDAITTRVRFRPLSAALIADYVSTGEPRDKAGAYGIQGIGSKLVVAIDGSYTNVVGLPLVEVLGAIADLGGPRR
jgi:septum formation protein